jgi:hypothetical protein
MKNLPVSTGLAPSLQGWRDYMAQLEIKPHT